MSEWNQAIEAAAKWLEENHYFFEAQKIRTLKRDKPTPLLDENRNYEGTPFGLGSE